MKEMIKNLTITEYCSSDKRKIRFIKEIDNDPLIKHFVSNSMAEWIEDSENLEKVLVGPAYIVCDNRKLVGFIRCASINDNILNLHYGVHPSYRRQNYGTMILNEVPKYLFNHFDSVKEIELWIKEINKGSIKCAIKNDFIYKNEISSRVDDCKIMIYSKKK